MKMFQRIQELIDDPEALVCVLIDEVRLTGFPKKFGQYKWLKSFLILMRKMAISIAISFEKQHILFSFDLLYTHDFSDYFKECLIVFVFYIASIFICQ